MFNHLTKIKVILLLLLVIGLFIKKDLILDTLSYDQKNLKTNSASIVISQKDIKNSPEEKSAQQIFKSQKKSKISFIVYDLGLMQKPLDLAFTLPSQVALGFSIYSDSLSSITRKSLEKYHNTFVLLPSKSSNYLQNDSGPLALFMNHSVADTRSKFNNLIEFLVSPEVGFYLTPSAACLYSEEESTKLLTLLEKYQDKIKFFLYLDSDNTTFFTKILAASSVKNKALTIDRILNETNPVALREDLQSLLKIADRKGFAIGALPASTFAIKELIDFIRMEKEVIDLIPLSSLVSKS